jgi:hypothetical protein
MDANAIITILTGVAGVFGGFVGGKRLGNVQATSLTVSTVGRTQGEEKNEQIASLTGRLSALEGLVTQRAEVEAVHVDVLENQHVLHRIAAKVGA